MLLNTSDIITVTIRGETTRLWLKSDQAFEAVKESYEEVARALGIPKGVTEGYCYRGKDE